MRTSSRLLPALAFLAAVIAAQVTVSLLGKTFYLTQLTMAVYYSIVAMGLCLVMGFAGQVSLGHGAFFALGGYTTAILTTTDISRYTPAAMAPVLKQLQLVIARDDSAGGTMWTVTPGAAFLAALAITLIVACLIGYPALRLKGHYLAMATLGFGMIVHKIILGSALAGATDGITGIPEWRWPGGVAISGNSALRIQNYYIACGLALLFLVTLGNLIQSRVGRALQAIHDRELAANAMGINTAAYKLKTFLLSALMAAVAGVFIAHYTGSIGPSEAGAMKSVRYVALVAAGGMSNLWLVAVVSIVINYLSLRGFFGSYDHAVFGALLIVIVSLAPEGPLKPAGDLARRLIRRCLGRKEGQGVAA